MLNREQIEGEISKLQAMTKSDDPIQKRIAFAMGLALRAVLTGRPSQDMGDTLPEGVRINSHLCHGELQS